MEFTVFKLSKKNNNIKMLIVLSCE